MPEVAEGAVVAGEVGEGVGITVMEGVGAALDDTGILAPIGLALGALGIGLGKSMRHDPKIPTNPVNEENYSFQAGFGM